MKVFTFSNVLFIVKAHFLSTFYCFFSVIMANKFFDSFNKRQLESPQTRKKKPFRLLKFLFLCSNVLIKKTTQPQRELSAFAFFVMNDARQLMKEIVEKAIFHLLENRNSLYFYSHISAECSVLRREMRALFRTLWIIW